jgi:pimeloyl-ACP methyl ester carboxylesterase
MIQTVLLHSTGTAPFMWDSIPEEVLASALRVQPANLGYPPYAAVPRGTKTTLAQDALHVLTQLPASGQLNLVAHSYGGLVALELLPVLGARVRSVFLLEPVLFGALMKDETADSAALARVKSFIANDWFLSDDEKGGTEPWLESFVDYWNRPGSWARLPEMMREHSFQVGWKMYQEVRSAFFEARTFEERPLPNIPVTLVMGERSPLEAREMVKSYARRHPWARTVELSGTGHMAPVTHPAKMHEALAKHLLDAESRAP